MLKNLFVSLSVLCTLSACVKPSSKGFSLNIGAGSGTGTGSGTGAGTGNPDFGLGLYVRGEGLGLDRLEIKSLTGAALVLAPGRIHGLIVENADQVRQPLTCLSGTQNNVLYVFAPVSSTGGALSFNCNSGSTAFSLFVSSTPAKLSLLSEKIPAVPQSVGVDNAPPAVTQDGRYLFYSVPSPSHLGLGAKQIVRLDTQTGLKRLVSNTANGTPGNGDSTWPSVSADGRYVAFVSTSTNFVSGLSGTQIYRKDLTTEAILLISTPNGAPTNVGANGPVSRPRISGDGDRVVFQGTVDNFGFAYVPSQQVFVRYVTANATSLLSTVNGSSTPGAADSGDATISSDGTKVSFTSRALITSESNGMTNQVYLAMLTPTGQPTVMVSRVGTGMPGSGDSVNCGLSSDGTYVFIRTAATEYGVSGAALRLGRRTVSDLAFTPINTDMSAVGELCGANSFDGNTAAYVSRVVVSGQDTFKVSVRDLNAGTTTVVKTLADFAPPLGTEAQPTTWAALSGNGSLVAFSTPAFDALPSVVGQQVFYKKLSSGTLQLGSTGDGNSYGLQASSPKLSGNGNFLVFLSADPRYAPAIRRVQAFRRNLTTGEIQLVSSKIVSGSPVPANANVTDVAISSTGRHVAFSTAATNFAAGATTSQVYLKDMSTGALTLISKNGAGGPGSRENGQPSVSEDGSKVLFASNSDDMANLGGGVTIPDAGRVYLRDLNGTPTTTLVSGTAAGEANEGNCGQPSLSDSGTRAAFLCQDAHNLSGNTTGYAQVIAKFIDTGAVHLVSTFDGTGPLDGNAMLPQISGDGTTYTFVNPAVTSENTGGHMQVYRKVIGQNAQIVSRSTAGTVSDGTCGAPSLNRTGDTFLFTCRASNLVAGAYGDHVYRKVVATGAIQLLSADADGVGGFNSSVPGNLSGSGEKAVFTSVAPNLIGGVSGQQVYFFTP